MSKLEQPSMTPSITSQCILESSVWVEIEKKKTHSRYPIPIFQFLVSEKDLYI